ncbi:c-type cytochrome [Hwanghaeella grinnelliae]|uniref:C-type cytochrome n=1 Tax=Hwanghaeella grinnelliae TaxID=2500179 RepID=A0A437QUH3_9PROT|nr:c-type cytochrome [Hwanghaeella grinnelliae]RVU38167.1 c-type cytochrome [Hwanghaeella grinnelliae]
METQNVLNVSAQRTRVGLPLSAVVLAFIVPAISPLDRPACAADLEYGAYLASECTTCHRADGEFEGIPAIVGWDEQHFVDALKAYLGTDRENPTMRTIVKRLTEKDMEALAAYFRSLAK